MTRITLTPAELAAWNAARTTHEPLTMEEANAKLAAMEEIDVAFTMALIRASIAEEEGRR